MLFGNYDKNIRIMEEQFNVKIVCRGTEIKISGEAESVEKANRAINALLDMIRRGDSLSEQNIFYVVSMVNQGTEGSLNQINHNCILVTVKGKPVKAKTLGQQAYLDAINKNKGKFGNKTFEEIWMELLFREDLAIVALKE